MEPQFIKDPDRNGEYIQIGKQFTYDLIPGGRANQPPSQNPTPPDAVGELRDVFAGLQDAQTRILSLIETREPADQIGALRVIKLREGLGVPLEQITDALSQIKALIPWEEFPDGEASYPVFMCGGIDLDDTEEIPF